MLPINGSGLGPGGNGAGPARETKNWFAKYTATAARDISTQVQEIIPGNASLEKNKGDT